MKRDAQSRRERSLKGMKMPIHTPTPEGGVMRSTKVRSMLLFLKRIGGAAGDAAASEGWGVGRT